MRLDVYLVLIGINHSTELTIGDMSECFSKPKVDREVIISRRFCY